MMLSGWGRYPRAICRLARPTRLPEAIASVASSASIIPRGAGRAYGDAALNPDNTLAMTRCDRFLRFDPTSGELHCEAGALLSDILGFFVPRGWFPPVTPGTKFVTLGGMIAADVHGKNHHVAGSFGDHVCHLHLALADGRVVRCSRDENPELFEATRGGMGLTGVILDACFRLVPIETAFVRRETLRARDLDEVMTQCEASRDWTYSVAWIDCLAQGPSMGRSLLFRGEHARLEELPASICAAPLAPRHRRFRRVPIDFPHRALNRWTVSLFNEAYYRFGRPGGDIVDYESFFYPLDALLEWNRIYGRAGFIQYQCALPLAGSRAGLSTLLSKIAAAGIGSFMSVLKLFGPQNGLLSFPREGFTLALDFPVEDRTFALLTELDAIVLDHGGRLYLAKDARTGPDMIRRGYPGFSRFADLRAAIDPQKKFNSLLSRRLDL